MTQDVAEPVRYKPEWIKPVAAIAAMVLLPTSGTAGQIYGQITVSGRSANPGIPISVTCPASAPLTTTTDRFGAYKVYAPATGRCSIAISFGGQRLAATVVSYPNPARYNFDISGRGSATHLVRR